MTEPTDSSPPAHAAPGVGASRAGVGTYAGAPSPRPSVHRPEFDGANADVWPITLRNAILNLISLFFYRFWARTEVRRYLWARTSLLGNRLAYTGTGKELFIGFLIVFFLVLVPFLAVSGYVAYAWWENETVQMVYGYSVAIVSYFLFYVASYRALRYRLSRTNWRGIRGTQTGSALIYGLKAMGWLLLMPFSMGLLYPVQRISLTGTKMNNAWFGDRRFTFDARGKSGQLYGPFMRAWLGFIFKPIGIILLMFGLFAVIGALRGPAAKGDMNIGLFIALQLAIWALVGIGLLRTYARYRARELAIMAPWVGFGSLRFALDADHKRIFRLMFGNIVITLLTLGLGKPFAQKRLAAFVAEHLRVIGEPDFGGLNQCKEKGPGRGEGLADAFDAGSI